MTAPAAPTVSPRGSAPAFPTVTRRWREGTKTRRAAVPPTRRPPVAPRAGLTAEDLLSLFGPIPLDRVCWDPFPGTATFDDCERLNEAGRRYELIDGILLEKAVGLRESEIAADILRLSYSWDPKKELSRWTGADGFVRLFPAGRTRAPDVSCFLRENLPDGRLPTDPIPALTPDFCVEVLSESNTREEIDGKLDDLFASGCRLAWVVDPRARTARIVTPAADGPRPWRDETVGDDATLAGDPVLPGFAAPLAELLDVPRPPGGEDAADNG